MCVLLVVLAKEGRAGRQVGGMRGEGGGGEQAKCVLLVLFVGGEWGAPAHPEATGAGHVTGIWAAGWLGGRSGR